MSIPGSVCGASRPIRLHDGHGIVYTRRFASRLGGGLRRIAVSSGWNHLVDGDLDGDGRNEAALAVECETGGGTADSALAYAQVIYRVAGGKATPLGVIRPRVQPKHVLPTLLTVTIHPGRVVAHEAFYGPHDGTCCPSGRATTIWIYKAHSLAAEKPSITRPAAPK